MIQMGKIYNKKKAYYFSTCTKIRNACTEAAAGGWPAV